MDNETKDILMMLLEKMDNMDKKMDNGFDRLEKRMTNMELNNETKIEPTLQAILENQTEVINQKAHISKVETKIDDVKDEFDVMKIVVKEHSKDIEELKKRA